MNKPLAALAVAIVLAPATASAQAAKAIPAASTLPRPAGSHPCATSTKSCTGTLRVPLDWDKPAGPTITVAFAWHPRRDQSRPAAGTVFANFGGPGPAIGPLSFYRAALGDVLDRQNLLLVDPRGHGESTPLTCAELDITRPATVRTCAEHLGPRVRSFGTQQVAHDIEAVRSALQVPDLTLYGNSYGTVVGTSYAARFPERVRALYLDSAVATDARTGYATDPLMTSSVFTAGRADLRLLCRRSAACRSLPGDPVDRLSLLVRSLRHTPDPRVPLDRLALLHIQLFEPSYARELNAATAAYLAGDRAPLHRLIDMLNATWGSEPPNPAQAGILATLCADSQFPYDRSADSEVKQRQLAAYYTLRQPFQPFQLDEVGPLGYHDYANACVFWPTAQQSPPIPPNADLPDVPVLIVAGDLDTTTPERGGQALAERFPNATYIEVPGGTHNATFGLPNAPHTNCVNAMMRRFVTDPDDPIQDPGCDARTYPVLAKYPITASQLPPAHDTVAVQNLTRAERTLISAAFSTVADATTRLNPAGVYAPGLPRQDGLRGGTIEFDHARHAAHLNLARFVADVAVTGTINSHAEHQASTSLTVTDPNGRPHSMTLTWPDLRPESAVRVKGTLDGIPFDVITAAA